MDPVKVAAVLATGLTLSGCGGTLDGLSASSGQEGYAAPGYYGAPAYPAPGYYAQPGYGAPYAYQPYAYEPGWGRGRDSWHEREWREHRESTQQRQDSRQVPQMAGPPRSFAPAAPPQMAPQPPAARPQADQNRKLLDQLGFRPSR